MKKLLTILVLIVLAGQITGCFPAKAQELSSIQKADEKADKGGDVKNEKECIHHSGFANTEASSITIYGIYSCNPGLFPFLHRPTPPPDGLC